MVILPCAWLLTFFNEKVDFSMAKLMINYGLDQMKLMEPVKVDSKLRMRAQVLSVKNLRGTIKSTMKLTFDLRGISKPACEAEVTYLYQF